MKKLNLTLVLILLREFGFGQIIFQKIIDHSNYEGANSVQQTADAGYIIAGSTSSLSAGDLDVYLIKTDVNGDTLWTKTFGGTEDDYSYSVQQTTDGGYITAGLTSSFGVGIEDVYLIKTDADGNLLWSKTFGGTGDDEGYCVLQTTDGGYIITGYGVIGADPGDIYIIKTDSNGDSLWTKTFDGTGFEFGNSIKQTSDGGYIIAGNVQGIDADVYLIKLDVSGNLLWIKAFGGASVDQGYSIQQTTDSGYIIAGYTDSFGAGGNDVYLIKTDANGDLIWTKTFGSTGNDVAMYVRQTSDSGYIVVGWSYNLSLSFYGTYLIKTNANGDTLWTSTFGGPGYVNIRCANQTADGGNIITGTINLFSDVYLIKTDSNGYSGCSLDSTTTIVTIPATQVTTPAIIVTSLPTIVTSPATIVGSGSCIITNHCTTVGIPEIKKNEEINIFPNPFSDKLNITAGNELVEVTLFDITSRNIFHQSFVNSTSINTEQLAKGIYLYEVRNKSGVIKKGKVVKD